MNQPTWHDRQVARVVWGPLRATWSFASRPRVPYAAIAAVAGVLCIGCAGPERSSAAAATQAGTPIGATGAGVVRVNEFMSYRPEERVIQLRLVSGYSRVNNTLNFNGATEGTHTVTVPVGWHVEAVLENSSELPHSAIVLKAGPPLSEVPETPAFSGAHAAMAPAGDGVTTVRSLSFVAARAGSYQIVCGVPYHGQAGMWIRLVVSDQATAPAYTIRTRGSE